MYGGEAGTVLLMLALMHQIDCGNWRPLIISRNVKSFVISVSVMMEVCWYPRCLLRYRRILKETVEETLAVSCENELISKNCCLSLW